MSNNDDEKGGEQVEKIEKLKELLLAHGCAVKAAKLDELILLLKQPEFRELVKMITDNGFSDEEKAVLALAALLI